MLDGNNDAVIGPSGIKGAYSFFDQAPVIIGFVRGKDYVVEFANQGLLKVWKTDTSIYGKSIFSAFPELEGQGFRHLLDNVTKTGIPFTAYEYPISFDRADGTDTYYFDFIYQPFIENKEITGVIAVGHDVTEKVLAKKTAQRGDKKWKQVADSLPVVVWTADEKGNADFFNALWYETTGLSPDETYGFGWSKVIHPDDLDRCMAAWNNALSTKTLYEIEARYRKKDGTYQWVLARGIPILENDVVIGWYGTSTDISGQKQIEQQLGDLVEGRTKEIEEKTNLLDSILTHSSNGISVSKIIFNSEGQAIDAQTILANDAAVKFVGLPKADYLSRPATHFDPNIITSEYGLACINTLHTGQPFIMRYFLEFSERWLELTVSKMDDRHLIHNFTDVTDIRKAELKLEKTLDDLKKSNANLEEFGYVAAHDLKEPIRKTRFFTDRLIEELTPKLTEDQKRLFDKLARAQTRMQSLVDDLLEYSQAAKGSTDLEEVDLEKELHSALEDLEFDIQNRSAKIDIGALPTITGKRRQLHQMFQNLVSNALKYQKPEIPPHVTITSALIKAGDAPKHLHIQAHDSLFYHIKVIDNGIGFKQEHAESAFKLFTRLHTTEQYRGSGIGLAIVKKVVESHDGFIWAESAPSMGATFHILLPKSQFTH